MDEVIDVDRNRWDAYLHRLLANVELGNAEAADADIEIVLNAYPGTLYHAGVHVDGVFHLGGANAVPRNIEYVIDPAGNPVISVFVTPGAIPGKVITFEQCEVGFIKALMVTI